MGRFRAPTLRNIAVTAPYMHDGSIATLDEVIDHYAAGGRTIEDGPHAGDGSSNPYKSDFIVGFAITAEERADVIAFLESLTDEAFSRARRSRTRGARPARSATPRGSGRSDGAPRRRRALEDARARIGSLRRGSVCDRGLCQSPECDASLGCGGTSARCNPGFCVL